MYIQYFNYWYWQLPPTPLNNSPTKLPTPTTLDWWGAPIPTLGVGIRGWDTQGFALAEIKNKKCHSLCQLCSDCLWILALPFIVWPRVNYLASSSSVKWEWQYYLVGLLYEANGISGGGGSSVKSTKWYFPKPLLKKTVLGCCLHWNRH